MREAQARCYPLLKILRSCVLASSVSTPCASTRNHCTVPWAFSSTRATLLSYQRETSQNLIHAAMLGCCGLPGHQEAVPLTRSSSEDGVITSAVTCGDLRRIRTYSNACPACSRSGDRRHLSRRISAMSSSLSSPAWLIWDMASGYVHQCLLFAKVAIF